MYAYQLEISILLKAHKNNVANMMFNPNLSGWAIKGNINTEQNLIAVKVIAVISKCRVVPNL